MPPLTARTALLAHAVKQRVLMEDILPEQVKEDLLPDDIASQYVLSSDVISATLALFIVSALGLAVLFTLEQARRRLFTPLARRKRLGCEA